MEKEDEEEDETEVKDECEESRLGCHTKRAAHHYLRDNYICKLKIQFRETLYCKGLIFINNNNNNNFNDIVEAR